ncbi:small GTP-binding protein [Hamiltosporidium magnivora]|uniref:Small GTP-binding protein n=1 Tax=Hamiltosporidium magnivora TaxID=148818 RepID=A0A4Q9LIF0_9MICR|nr:small GTP-binding protein [Hamiltosporidium magnivora]
MRSKYKIVFLGTQSVGKTTLISQFVHRHADEKYHPTIGIDFLSTKIDINGKEVKLQLWDTAGQERFNSIIPNYTRDSFIAIVVFDLSNQKSFEQIDHWINDLVRIHDTNNYVKVIIAGNKKDLISEEQRLSFSSLGNQKAQEHKGKYVETSAMKYEDIYELVKTVNDYIFEDIQRSDSVIDLNKESEVINLEATRKGRCC